VKRFFILALNPPHLPDFQAGRNGNLSGRPFALLPPTVLPLGPFFFYQHSYDRELDKSPPHQFLWDLIRAQFPPIFAPVGSPPLFTPPILIGWLTFQRHNEMSPAETIFEPLGPLLSLHTSFFFPGGFAKASPSSWRTRRSFPPFIGKTAFILYFLFLVVSFLYFPIIFPFLPSLCTSKDKAGHPPPDLSRLHFLSFSNPLCFSPTGLQADKRWFRGVFPSRFTAGLFFTFDFFCCLAGWSFSTDHPGR